MRCDVCGNNRKATITVAYGIEVCPLCYIVGWFRKFKNMVVKPWR